jgi:hypothetical protein
MVLKIFIILFILINQMLFAKTKTINSEIKIKESSSPIKKMNLLAGLLSFQDKVSIKSPSGTNFDMLNTTFVTSVGFARTFDYSKIHTSISCLIFAGNSNIQADVQQFTYPSTKTPTFGGQLNMQLMHRFDLKNQYLLGANLGVIYKYSKWSKANSPNGVWIITPNAKIIPNITIDGEYYFKKLFVFHRFGYGVNISSLLWTVGIGFTL